MRSFVRGPRSLVPSIFAACLLLGGLAAEAAACPATPNVIKALLIANVGVFVLQNLGSFGPFVTQWFSARPIAFWEAGALWQPATYMWLHAPGSLMHIGFNMFALWMFGSPLASAWGDKRFLRYYLLSGIGAGLIAAPAVAGGYLLIGNDDGQLYCFGAEEGE